MIIGIRESSFRSIGLSLVLGISLGGIAFSFLRRNVLENTSNEIEKLMQTTKRKTYGAINKCSPKTLANSGYIVEICLSDIESARQAVEGGATSLELCANRREGGTTPSIGLIEECVRLCRNRSVEVNVLIRPRAGDFLYSNDEFEVVVRDTIAAIHAGADGIVCGILTSDCRVDVTRMSILRELTKKRGVKLTFHRAVDLCEDYELAIHDIISLKCDRLLTSGLEVTAQSSCRTTLRHMVQLCEGHICAVAASGISALNVQEIIEESGIKGVHSGSGVDVVRFSNINLDTNSSKQSQMERIGREMEVWSGADSNRVEELVRNAFQTWKIPITTLPYPQK